jgi:hypothetical protein
MLCLSGRNSLAYPCYLIKTYVLVIDLSVIADQCAEFTWPNLTPPTPALVMESIRKIILDLPDDGSNFMFFIRSSFEPQNPNWRDPQCE